MFLHIGLGRSGSTFLQRKIFPYFKKVKYMSGGNSRKFEKDRINYFYNPFFLPKYKYSGKNLLVSTETFFHSKTSIIKLINEIDQLFEKPRILLILRNPFDHLISTYKNIVKTGNIWMRLEDHFSFDNTFRSELIRPNEIFNISLYKYKNWISLLKNKYEVKVYFFEEIFQDYRSMKKFVNELSSVLDTNFIGKFKPEDFIKINKSLTNQKEIKKKRIKNFLRENKKSIKKFEINEIYFDKIYSESFKRKFEKSIKYEKLKYNLK